MSEHHHPKPPDESNLWNDRSWAAIAHAVAGMWFAITFAGAGAFVAAVGYWIFDWSVIAALVTVAVTSALGYWIHK